MMNVNFFEKKKINLLPYIIGGLFLLSLLLMSIYFYFARMSYEQATAENNTWLSNHAEEVVLSRRISRLDGLATESATVQENLQANQYPMDEIASDLASTVPNEAERVASFHITDPNQVTLILENTQATQAQDIVEALEEKTYVDAVQFLHAENQNPEEDEMRIELIVQINAENAGEVETE